MAVLNPRRLVMALAIATAGATLAAPAGAQFSNGHAAFDRRPTAEPVEFREFFRFPFFEDRRSSTYAPFFFEDRRSSFPFGQTRPQTFESNKAPPPRKVQTPPVSTVLVIGDSFADWLGYGLEEVFADTPEIGIVRKIRPYSGLVRYEARADAPEWPQAIREVLAAEKPNAIVVMLGVNDRLPLRERSPSHPAAASSPQGQEQGQAAPPAARPSSETGQPDGEQSATAASEAQHRTPGSLYEFHTDPWAELYGKRIDEMIAALKSKGVPLLWVGLPAIRGTRSTSDMSYLDELYRAHAEKGGITYVDIWDGFVDDRGQFAVQGPDFEGQIRRLRSFDGVYFTKTGAEKLAHYVEHELRRVLTNRAVPVALPVPEEQSPAKGSPAGARPAVGPVVPLNVSSGESGDLLGAGSHSAQRETDPIATRVLSRGDAAAAPAGRADDFSWPRAGVPADGGSEAMPAPEANAPAAPAASGGKTSDKGEPNKAEANKAETNKSDAKKAPDVKAQAAPNGPPAAKPRRSGAVLDGAPPRPPLPIAPAAADRR